MYLYMISLLHMLNDFLCEQIFLYNLALFLRHQLAQ